MAATATKICTICNTDCADRPRVKDELGHYACKACLEKQQAKAAPPAAAGAATAKQLDDDGLDLRTAAMMEAKTEAMELPEGQSCPKCHGFMPNEQRLCMRCGYDRKRGAKVMTRVEKVKEVSEDRPRRSLFVDPTWVVLALGLPIIACGVWAFVSPIPAGLIFYLAYAGFSLTTSVAVAVAQARDSAWGYMILTGLSFASTVLPIIGQITGDPSLAVGGGLVAGGIGLLAGLANLYWVFVESGRTYLQLSWCMCIVMRVMLYGIIVSAVAQASS